MKSSDHNVQIFKEELLKKMYRLQEEINYLWINYPRNVTAIGEKEAEITRLFRKLRAVRSQEKQK